MKLDRPNRLALESKTRKPAVDKIAEIATIMLANPKRNL